MPSDTPAKGDVKPSDVTVSGSAPPIGGTTPPATGKGWSSLSRNKKYAVIGVGALAVGVVAYVIIKKKDASSTAASTATTTPAADSTNGEVAETPQYDGQGSVGGYSGGGGGSNGGGSSNFSNTLTQLFTTQDQSIAADIAALNTANSGSSTQGSSTSGTSTAASTSSSGAATTQPAVTSSAAPVIYQDLSDSQANQLYQSGTLSAAQALADETPASQLSPAERKQQISGNAGLRALLK